MMPNDGRGGDEVRTEKITSFSLFVCPSKGRIYYSPPSVS